MKKFKITYNGIDNTPCVDIYTLEAFLYAGGINGLFQSYTKFDIAILDFGWIEET